MRYRVKFSTPVRTLCHMVIYSRPLRIGRLYRDSLVVGPRWIGLSFAPPAFLNQSPTIILGGRHTFEDGMRLPLLLLDVVACRPLTFTSCFRNRGNLYIVVRTLGDDTIVDPWFIRHRSFRIFHLGDEVGKPAGPGFPRNFRYRAIWYGWRKLAMALTLTAALPKR